MFASDEKVIILGSLLHDIGKFEQRCTNNPKKLTHDLLGKELVSSGRFQHRFEKIVGKDNFDSFVNVINDHHGKNGSELIKITQTADHLSASERVNTEKNEENRINWKHKHLASLFSKINLLSDQKINPKYYKHRQLTGKDFEIIIPQEITEEEIKFKDYAYVSHDFDLFQNELEAVLDFYQDDSDFASLINLLLILLEKWMWCIPDFTGSPETDISLYNHLKDVAALGHAIFITKKENNDSKSLNLVIGDLPGIQNYIFDVVNKKPAKVLRGRSIFVQILTRNFATLFLNECGLTEANLIMLAGGKFYIIAPDTEKFISDFSAVQKKIEEYLFEEFRMELSFNSTYYKFNYLDLKSGKLTFGQIIEEASFKLLENRHLLFKNRLFENNRINKNNYIWKENYIDDDGTSTDSIKCSVTGKPIRNEKKDSSRLREISEGAEKFRVDKQAKNEYEIGNKVTGDNLVITMDKDYLNIDPNKIFRINSKIKITSDPKILINPNLEGLLKKVTDRNIFKNACYLEVANYCSSLDNDETSVLPFEDMVKFNKGAEYLSLIKGDIDNLGLIMAYGLTQDKDDLTAISRTTTLSNHLKYYFSFFLNGFLEHWGKIDINNKENKVYTIFAGGDDLMLIAPQGSAVKLVQEFNKKFREFVCDNDEVHISYSITHFKDRSPIRIVADIAEKDQMFGKKSSNNKQSELFEKGDLNSFKSLHDKACTTIFNSVIKNSDLNLFIELSDQISFWVQQNDLSRGILRKLLDSSEMIKKYEKNNDAIFLIAYARLTYAINRMKKNKPEIENFLKKVLLINPVMDKDASKIQSLLNPLICQVIYNIRN